MLVMDDDARRTDMERRLDRAGYSSVIAADGSAALTLLNQVVHVPATILLDADVRPPVLRALLTALATIPALANVPIIFIRPKASLPEQLVS